MKKLLAVLISLCMVSAFAVPVFADANSDYIAAVKAYQAQIAAKEAAYVAAVDAYSKNAKAKADADSAAPALPPLVQAAIADIRANYAGLYGVEELSERLGVSKSHLVRTFTAAIGVPPGRYLTTVRIEACLLYTSPSPRD